VLNVCTFSTSTFVRKRTATTQSSIGRNCRKGWNDFEIWCTQTFW